MNNTIMRKVEITENWKPLNQGSLFFAGSISCPPENAADVTFEGDDGSEVPWVPGEWHDFTLIDLSAVRVKGAAGDVVTIIGEGA